MDEIMKYLVCNFKNKLNKEDIIKYSNKLNELGFKNIELVICPSNIYLFRPTPPSS